MCLWAVTRLPPPLRKNIGGLLAADPQSLDLKPSCYHSGRSTSYRALMLACPGPQAQPLLYGGILVILT